MIKSLRGMQNLREIISSVLSCGDSVCVCVHVCAGMLSPQ